MTARQLSPTIWSYTMCNTSASQDYWLYEIDFCDAAVVDATTPGGWEANWSGKDGVQWMNCPPNGKKTRNGHKSTSPLVGQTLSAVITFYKEGFLYETTARQPRGRQPLRMTDTDSLLFIPELLRQGVFDAEHSLRKTGGYANLVNVQTTMTVTDRKFIIFTWGCQMNEDDAEQIASLLMQMGYSPTDTPEAADLAMLVTCSVRAKPEQKAKSKLGELRLVKESNPGMIIGVCGCMAQKEGEQLRKHRPYLDLVVGTASIWRIPELISEVQRKRGFRSALEMPRNASDSRGVPPRTARQGLSIKSFVPVMYGCDNFCSYCVVPYVRGKERSREVDDIVREVADLAHSGRKEVTLLGQNVNSYGAALSERTDFADLLRAVSDVRGIERIRFTTSHPKDLSDKLIEAIRGLPKVCEHIHLAVQSGDDEILARMNRKYTSAHIRERVAALRSAIPDIAITTDFLVGFPGETEAQFDNTMRLAEEVRFDAAFMFAFNPIPRTAAAGMEDQLAESDKGERLNRLIRVQNAITCEVNDACIGNTYQVLVEGVSPKDTKRLTGLTRQNKTMNFPGSLDMIGKQVCVRVTEGHLYGYVGESVLLACAGGQSGR